MAEELAKHYVVRIVGPDGAAALAPQSIPVTECLHKPLWKFLLRAGWSTIHEAFRFRPNVILAGSGLMAPLAYLAASLVNSKTAVYLHGLDIASRHPLYRMLWLPAIRHIDHIIVNSRATRDLALTANVAPNRMGLIHPGVALPTALPSPVAIAQFRNKYQLGSRPILLSVGRLTARKGLQEFVEQALPGIVQQTPDILLVVIGDTAKDALYAKNQSSETILARAEALGVGNNIRFLGSITNWDMLATAYAAATAHVFPVREMKGDPEGFGMVAIEAAAYGAPTVAFATGGVTDAVSHGFSGYLIPPGDYLKFSEAVVEVIRDPETLKNSCRQFAKQFAWENFGLLARIQLSKVTEDGNEIA